MAKTDAKYSQNQFARWLAEIKHATKDEKYRKWLDQCDKIVKRYRDERRMSSADVSRRRYNILWANVQTLGPAIYGKMPKPIAERRFLDRDPSARLASLLLERVLAFQMDVGGFHEATDKSVHDYLLPGLGQVWVRYEAEFESNKLETEDVEIGAKEEAESPDEANDEGFGEVEEKLSYEQICFDYVFYRDFLWSPSRVWKEVPWIAKRCWLDKAESEEEFGQEIANQMVFGDPRQKDLSGVQSTDPIVLGNSKKAEVWEIWCKPERKVYFIAPDSPGLLLKEEDDPLKLEGFWPCPEPLFATQTNDTLVPVPDYIEYQDQAMELDDLTDRIDNITTAVRANGVYNAEFPALQRLMQSGQDNKLIPVDDWSAFSEKGGMPGGVSLLPMEEIITVLQTLYDAREHTLQDCYQITGVSDIIRGATDPNETASAQKIKANYATGRLGSRQERVAEFCAQLVRIAGELIAEVFSDDSLKQMSGIDQMFRDQVRQAIEDTPAPPKPELPPTAPPQALQLAQQQWQMQFDVAKKQAAATKQQELDAQFAGALAILRSDKLRGFRVDIETDSTIADDLQQDKQAVTEFVQSLFQSIQGAEVTLSQAPELVKPLGETILFAARKFRVGRTLEAAWEDALDKLEKRIEDMRNQPKQPSPDELKAQADVQIAQAKVQTENIKAAAESDKARLENAAAQAKIQGEQQALQLQATIDALKLRNEQLTASVQNTTEIVKAKFALLQAILVARISAGADLDSANVEAEVEMALGFATMEHERRMQEMDQQHEQSLQTQQQGHEQTMQANAPQPEGSKSKPKQKPLRKADQQHEEAMSRMAEVASKHEQVAQALMHVGNSLKEAAAARKAPRRIVTGPDGRPVGIQ